MFGLSEYFMAGSVAVALAAGGYGFIQQQSADIAQAELKTTKMELAVKRGELASCGNRLQTILADLESDNEIDNLTDADLRNVPEHWLLSEPDTTPAGN